MINETAEHPTIVLCKQLIREPSVTPLDLNCQKILAERLKCLGFSCETLQFKEVTNLWACKGDASAPLLMFAGHTDVVPTGPLDQWISHPFEPAIRNGILFGRGVADMKGSIAAMVVATERFLKKYPTHAGRLGFLITSDEEGPAKNGTVKVVEYLVNKGETIDFCLVGEPSSTNVVGDVVKVGRRGSLGAKLRIIGTQGHIAYPHLAANPIHLAAPAIVELAEKVWDKGNAFFPPTTFQISNVYSGTGATNVIPGDILMDCNFRFSTQSTAEGLKQAMQSILNNHQLNFEVEWNLSGEPFLTESGRLVEAVTNSIKKVAGRDAEKSTSGGTSDGRFIAPTGAEVVELGPCNASIHQINEQVDVKDLIQLTDIYHEILVQILV